MYFLTLLGFGIVQNRTMSKKPFDVIAEFNKRPVWGTLLDKFRTILIQQDFAYLVDYSKQIVKVAQYSTLSL